MPVMKKKLVVTTVEVMVLTVMQGRLVMTALEVMQLAVVKVGGDNTGGSGASDEQKVGADNSGGDGAYSQGACNDEEEVGGHSCRDAFDFEENEEPWGAFI